VAEGVREARTDPEAVVAHGPGDLADPAAPAALVDTAAEALGGRLDILVANHALSGTLDAVDAAMLDAHWATDARSVILLAQAYARLRAKAPAGPGGRLLMMTSGQDLADGMPGELAYALAKGALAKGALASATRTLATTLAGLAVTVNTVNPGPVDTGYLTGPDHAAVAAMFPAGRWGCPTTRPASSRGSPRTRRPG
jgi:3-oxoacyl-[acyl-carrier protein] reductase